MATSGCGDGTVPANGHLSIEGQRASGGRLMLTRIGGGPQAFSLVTEEGEFALRASGDARGAFPGSYRVSFHHPLDPKSRGQFARELKGELAVDELTESFRGPRDTPFVIPEEGDENLAIDVRQSAGWTRSLNE
ncbi:MAG: hypothetical protein WD971_05365 [Pirellulales bacterium]